VALALAAPSLADAEQPAQARVGGAVGRIDEQRRAVDEIEAAADDQPHAGLLRGLVGAHDAGERVPVDDAERGDAKELRLLEQLARARRAAQEAEMRRDLQLGVPHDRGLLPEDRSCRLPCDAGSNQASINDIGSVNAAISKFLTFRTNQEHNLRFGSM
jgi:hypothetical protein